MRVLGTAYVDRRSSAKKNEDRKTGDYVHNAVGWPVRGSRDWEGQPRRNPDLEKDPGESFSLAGAEEWIIILVRPLENPDGSL